MADKNREPSSGPALYYVLLLLPVILGIIALIFKKPDSELAMKASAPKEASGTVNASHTNQEKTKGTESPVKKSRTESAKEKNSK